MKVLWGPDGWSDYLYWQETEPRILRQINILIADIARSPFEGLGKPEPLWRELDGWWSRRITREHRLVYQVIDTGDDRLIEIIGCRYHYRRP